MRATARMLTGAITLGLLGQSAAATAASPVLLSSTMSTVVLGQAPRGSNTTNDRQQADQWLRKAQQAIQAGKFAEADYWIKRAESLNIQYPAATSRYEYTPAKARQELESARNRGNANARLPSSSNGLQLSPSAAARSDLNRLPPTGDAGFAQARNSVFNRGNQTNPQNIEPRNTVAGYNGGRARQSSYQGGPADYPVSRGVYRPENDRSRNSPAAFDSKADGNLRGNNQPASGEGRRLYDQGMQAFSQRDTDKALDLFRQAWRYRDQLDPRTRQDLQDKLNLLPGRTVEAVPSGPARPTLDQLDAEQRVARQKLQQEVFRERSAAEGMRDKDPRGALTRLQKLHDRVAASTVDGQVKRQLLNIVGQSVVEMERYIDQNRAEIENEEINRERLADVESRRFRNLEVQNELALLVEQFNKLLDEERFAEANVIAQQAYELAPEEPVTQNLMWKAKFARRLERQMQIRDAREDGVVLALEAVEDSATPIDDRDPYQFGNIEEWQTLSASRREQLRELNNRLSPEEIRIQGVLKSQKVEVKFTNRPLREVLDVLAAQAGVNIHLDARGLHAEGLTSDAPVNVNLTQPITLKSALNLILDDLNLGYVVRDEVIRVTSEELKDEQVFQKTYYVADLVIPIPNFVPSYNMGLPGAIAAAHQSLGHGGNIPTSGAVPMSVAANADWTNPVSNNPRALANVGPNGTIGSSRNAAAGPMGFTHGGPGGAGGGPIADFDSLIELITTTIAPTTWDEVGGPGSVSGFETNLSLVVSQTQEVHDQLADLLEQLRRLQDLQVTIEVRFITLEDDFFERIGVDFDVRIDDNVTAVDFDSLNAGALDDQSPSVMVGFNQNGFTGDLDIPFNQGSFASATPQFGGFDANTAASLGFAILSDIEMFFLLEAAQGNERNNVMEAPKVTLFNGQQAFVSDTRQQPFVTSVIPVVGDFAVAHQPVIVVLSEGTSLSVQAVVSSDRRFVRLTLVPFFSQIGEVQEFTFNGKTTVKTDNFDSATAAGDVETDDEAEVITEGTTVQLPEFIFTTVTTTVSVPDGGTVLLGGVKRLSEGRTERGVPLLSKVPYINRLFRNTGIGRSTSSLMLMVTPRIIIQEEEEEKAVGRVLNN